MCDISTALMGISGGLGLIGQLSGGNNSTEASASFQAQQARNNAQIAEQNARDAAVRGQAAERENRQLTAQKISEQRSLLASSGFDINSGSLLDAQGDTALLGEVESKKINANSIHEQNRYMQNAALLRNDAAFADYRAKTARTNRTTSTLLGTAQQFSGFKWGGT